MRLAPLLSLLLTAGAAAQTAPTPGTCALGRAEALIHPGQIEAAVYNTGALFFGNDRTNGDGYLIPRGSGISPLETAGLWLGGKVGGEIRVAGARYSSFTFWPGPLGDGGTAPADCSVYDRIYRVSRRDVAAYLAGGAPTADLRDWPAALGAPVLDGDGVAGNYNLAGGDQPALRGDDAAWWLMNDVGNAHRVTNSPALGVEVRVEAFGFDVAPNSASSRLSETTFYRYTVTNRTAQTIDSLYAGFLFAPALGSNYVGTDTTTATAYAYNASNSSSIYGAAPPAIGFQVAHGPVGMPNGRDDDRDGTVDEPGERLRLTASPYFINGASLPAVTDPSTTEAYFNYLRGRWGDGTVKRERGAGYGETQGAVTPFSFAGDPVAGNPWSEVNNGTSSPRNQSGQRRTTSVTGPFRLAPGASETVTFAFLYARGTSNLDSVTRLRGLAGVIRSVFADGDLEPVRVTAGALPVVSQDVRLSRPFPNPTSGRATVTYEMPAGTLLRATLLDVLGREIAVLIDGPTASATGEFAIDGSRLAPGVYRVRVVVPAAEQILHLVVAR